MIKTFLLIALFCTLSSITTKNVVCDGEFNVAKNVEFLCKNKVSELSKISQVKSIIDYVKSEKETLKCDPKIIESILDMEDVVTKDLNDVCTAEKVDRIRDYHDKYISIDPDEPDKSHLPKSLRNFYLAFGIKVSYICKKNMINSLLYDPHQMLNENDFNTMVLWTSKSGSMMNDIIGAPVDYDDLLLASDLAYLKGDNGSNNEKIFIQTATGNLINKIQMHCERRFKPFYQKLIIPLVSLSNIGYNFQGEELERELAEMKTNKEVNQWYRIVYLCESLKDMEMVDDGSIDGADQRVVRILTKDEVDNMKRENALKPKTDEELEQIDYRFSGQIPIDDTIIDEGDKNLSKLISNFDAKKKEADRIRSKVFRKLGGFVSKVLKQKQIKFVTNFFKKKLFDKGPEKEPKENHPKEDIVYAIDDFVQLKTQDVDMPVAGIKDYMKRVHHNSVYLGPSGVAHKVDKKIKYWTPGRIFWYSIAIIFFAVGCALLVTPLG